MKAVMEGTWDELAEHADEFRRYPKLTLIVPDSEEPTPPRNQRVLDMLAELAERHKNRPTTSPADTDRMIREGRSGGMYNLPIKLDE